MIENLYNQGGNVEKEPGYGHVNIFFVRHGEPTEYGADDAHLSEEGILQVAKAADYFNHRLRFDPGDAKTAVYMHSDRIRAFETSKILAEEAEYFVKKNNLNVRVVEVANPHAFISAENTLTKIMDSKKCPRELAAQIWLRMPHERAELLGIRSSRDVAEDARKMILELDLMVDRPQMNESQYYFLGTHETTLMAMLYHLPPYKEFSVDYADFLEVNIDFRGGPKLIYRNKGLREEYWRNIKLQGHNLGSSGYSK